MGDAKSDFPLIEANLRRWRAIYAWIVAGGALLTGLLGLYLYGGGELEGPAIAFAMFAAGMLLLGIILLVPRLSIRGSDVMLTLEEEPDNVIRVGLKRTESEIAGARAASYSWIVIALRNRADIEFLVKRDDIPGVVAEIRRVAPDAELDPRWRVQRTEIRIR